MNALTQFAATVKKIGTDSDKHLETNVKNIITNVIAVLGIVCVIVIIIGGVQYMSSSGDPGKVKKAKDTILYGVIGLIICALAFAIVNFVIGITGQSMNQSDCEAAGNIWTEHDNGSYTCESK